MGIIPLITIVGVPNTGKSTLFNRILGKRKALVHSLPGMTRDIFRQKVKIDEQWFALQDSGGFFLDKEIITLEINKKILRAAEKSDLIIFLFDGKRELLGYEKDLYLQIKRLHKHIIPVLNKVDNLDRFIPPSTYFELKTDFVYISAEHNLGVEVLLEQITRLLQNSTPVVLDLNNAPRISIIGKPNVGKSSIINKILNDELVIVSPLPGTTRDSIDLEVIRNRQRFILVDNAGIRKLQKVKEDTESAAVIRAEKEMRAADIIIFIIDISKRVDQNDLLIAQKIVKAAKPVIIAANKADLLSENTGSNKFFAQIHNRFNALYFADFIAVSAKTGKNIFQMLDLAESVMAKLDEKIKLSSFNELAKKLLRERKLTTADHRIFSPKYISIESQRPFFIKFHCKSPLKLKVADEMYLKKRFTQELHFQGIPIFFKISASR